MASAAFLLAVILVAGIAAWLSYTASGPAPTA